MRKKQIIFFNIILFLYQFEFVPVESDDFNLSFYRIGILPLLILMLFTGKKRLLKKDTSKYIVSFLFFASTFISIVGYNYYSNLTTLLGNIIQLVVAYFYFQDNKLEKSSLYVLATWGLFQLPYFLTDLATGSLGLSHRFVGFHWDPNYLCMSLLISFWAKVYLVRNSSSIYLKVVLLALSFMDVLMILFSLSRGGLLALLITGIIYTFFYHRKLFYIMSILSVSLVTYMIERSQWISWSEHLSLFDLIIYRTFVIAETGDISAGRLTFIERYIEMIGRGEGILFGMPLNHYIQFYNYGGYPHNSIIEILIQGGFIIGSIFYLFLIFQILKMIYNTIISKVLPYELLFAISGLSVLMFLSFGLKISWLFVGMIFAISNKNSFKMHYTVSSIKIKN